MTRDAPHDSVQIDALLVKQLVADQFPRWSDLAIEPVEFDGHDNRTFHLGDHMCVRMPSGKPYAAHVGIEYEWLPKLGPRLPLPVPLPLGKGTPGLGYPWPWTVNKWIRGQRTTIERILDLSEFAKALANFLNTLQSLDASDAPVPGEHNFFRGGPLSVYDSETRESVGLLQDVVDASAAADLWQSALDARWDQPPVWIHGDVAEANLLVEEGRLCAVIDFGQLAAGDPSCDVTIAWTLFSGPSREVFRSELDVDEATWQRGRGWGLWKALLELRTHRARNSLAVARAQRVVGDILAD